MHCIISIGCTTLTEIGSPIRITASLYMPTLSFVCNIRIETGFAINVHIEDMLVDMFFLITNICPVRESVFIIIRVFIDIQPTVCKEQVYNILVKTYITHTARDVSGNRTSFHFSGDAIIIIVISVSPKNLIVIILEQFID